MVEIDLHCAVCNTQQLTQPPLALAVPLSRFTSRVGGGSLFSLGLTAAHAMKHSAPRFAVAALSLLGAALAYSGFASDSDASAHGIDGLWSGTNTNWAFGDEAMSVKLTTNGCGVVVGTDHNIAIPGTFTYTIVQDQIVFITNDSPALRGTLRYDSSSDALVYQERAEVAAALRQTCGPVILLRDTDQSHNAMLGSMVGATNYTDVMSRLGRFMGTLTNGVEKSPVQKKAQQDGAANGSHPIHSETNQTSSGLAPVADLLR